MNWFSKNESNKDGKATKSEKESNGVVIYRAEFNRMVHNEQLAFKLEKKMIRVRAILECLKDSTVEGTGHYKMVKKAIDTIDEETDK